MLTWTGNSRPMKHARWMNICADAPVAPPRASAKFSRSARCRLPARSSRRTLLSATASRGASRHRGHLRGSGIGFLFLVTAIAAVVIASALVLTQFHRSGERQLMSELVDQHVATLASSNPVDVVSTDRHTVKPWFEGKIPFTFNLPELQGSPFVLAGGRVAYVNQSPGAELIFRVRQHQISVFIFQERALGRAGGSESVRAALSFEVRTWCRNGPLLFHDRRCRRPGPGPACRSA